MERWRYIADDGVTASLGLAADEYMTRQVGSQASPPILRLYTYRSHCALVGRFQRVDAEVNRDFCLREGIPINRRPTGGGAIIMGLDQLGVALIVPEPRRTDGYDRARELFTRFSSGIVQGLRVFGISAEFKRKNDVEVDGRKIAGLGIYFDPGSGLLFHASLLVDLDIPLMLRVLKTPFEKISDKEIATVAERVTTVRRECRLPVSVPEVRDRILAAYEDTLGFQCDADSFTPAELEAIRALEREKYASSEWIELRTLTPDAVGSAMVKIEGGLLTVSATLVGETIKAIYLTGDFFAHESTVAALERGLRWHSSDPQALRKTLVSLEERDGVRLPRISSESMATAIEMAVARAKGEEAQGVSKGCFVNP